MQRWGMFVLCLCVMLGLSVPHADAKVVTVHTDYRLDNVKLISLSGREQKAYTPAHPATMTIAKMSEMLSSIRLSRRAFFSKKKIDNRVIFDEAIVAEFAPHLVKALAQAANNQVVVFSFVSHNARYLVRNNRFTSGRMWVADNALHIDFNKVFAKLEDDLSKRGLYSSRAANNARGVRVVLEVQPGQQLAARNAREIILPLDQTFAGAGPSNPDAANTPEQRLEELQRLRDMGLITDTEYSAKRQAVLNGL